jgi:hypothetical protein
LARLDDKVWIGLDRAGNRITAFNYWGRTLFTAGGFGSRLGKLDRPLAMSVQGDYALITDAGNGRLAKIRVKYQSGGSSLKYQETLPDPLFLSLTDIGFMPNPFASLHQNGALYYYLNADAAVTLRIYDSGGRLVRQYQAATGGSGGRRGLNSLPWDGRNGAGRQANNGSYTFRIKAVYKTLQAEAACRMTIRN